MNYELMIVTGAKGDGEALISRVGNLIKGGNGQDVKVANLGKKTLAYPINKQKEATYFLLNFEAPTELALIIGEKLRLEQEEILRYMLVKVKKIKKVKKEVVVSKPEVDVQTPKVKVDVKTSVKPKTTKITKAAKSTKAVESVSSPKAKRTVRSKVKSSKAKKK